MDELKSKVEAGMAMFERFGFPPIASKILAYLMYAEPPKQSFYDIQEFLGVSKGAVSTNLNLLQSMGLVDFVRVTGDRKRYFRMAPSNWVRLISREFEGLRPFRLMFEEMVELRADDYPELSAEWHELTELYRLLEQRIPEIMEEWKQAKEAAHPSVESDKGETP